MQFRRSPDLGCYGLRHVFHVANFIKMATRYYSASEVLEKVFDEGFGLSDSDDSDEGGEGVQGYLPMGSLGSCDDDEVREPLGEDGVQSEEEDEEPMDVPGPIESEDSSGEPSPGRSTILETGYKLMNDRCIVKTRYSILYIYR